ncbi:MAG TPA: palindromic element RPE3 domain-containing protein [Rickettsia endosymbiont of Pyrocoelia pectoralis]|nr:palindromic element RPE3 domain-containing protein [Rickettsia endosymbiont of Pyrocoelia pectoralis]
MREHHSSYRTTNLQLNSKSFRQDEFKGEAARRSKLREQRRIL